VLQGFCIPLIKCCIKALFLSPSLETGGYPLNRKWGDVYPWTQGRRVEEKVTEYQWTDSAWAMIAAKLTGHKEGVLAVRVIPNHSSSLLMATSLDMPGTRMAFVV